MTKLGYSIEQVEELSDADFVHGATDETKFLQASRRRHYFGAHYFVQLTCVYDSTLRFGIVHDFRCPTGSDITMPQVYAETFEQIESPRP